MDLAVNGPMADPFFILGMHRTGPENGGRLEIRSFCPLAERMQISCPDGKVLPMQRIHPDGLFAWISAPDMDAFTYTLLIETPEGISWETRDPYSFLPQLGEIDLHLLGEGKHFRLYNVLGARIREVDGCLGVLFSVWAPNATGVRVIGSFNDWDRRRHPMRSRGDSGIWELFIPDISRGDLYKYSIDTQSGGVLDKTDPFGLRSEFRPATASVVEDLAGFHWTDEKWMRERSSAEYDRSRISIYEFHPTSWKRPSDGRDYFSWDELGDSLLPWVSGLGFTHIELLPVMEHPFDGSWGYQTLGYFSPTSRLGTPDDFQRFVDRCHADGIGVILDWAPAHFPSDPAGLAGFDGTCLYEHSDPRQGLHPDWGTLIFNYDRNEVRNFLIASGLFWLDKYHIDGLRVDAVASMLYLDYSRSDGQWLPNRDGGRENLGAMEMLRTLNSLAPMEFPGVMTFAEESTAWPGVTAPVNKGGLGFTFKWNMGWMNDTLRFFSRESIHRKHHLGEITFSLLYAFSERFILPLSHDEMVHGKASLQGKMPGDKWRRFANLRLLLAYQWTHPGKQLLFMGSELGQFEEWDHDSSLKWELLEYGEHRGIADLVRDLNAVAEAAPPLYLLDASPEGFRWIDFSDTDSTIISFRRIGFNGEEVICVFNLTPIPRENYSLGVPLAGSYTELLNTDASAYGGSGLGNLGCVESVPEGRHGLPNSISLTLPPLSALLFRTPTVDSQKQD